MMPFTKTLILSILLSAYSFAAGADEAHSLFQTSDLHLEADGAIDGGSVGDDVVKASAWFVDSERMIKYCQVHASDFSLTSQETSVVLRKAFSRWRNYLQAIKLSSPNSPLKKIAYQAEETDCAVADVTFYFGYEDPVINEDRKSFSRPLAYVLRKSPSTDSWGKGYAWFNKKSFSRLAEGAPRWPALMQLEVLALHEIGHILGFAHVPGTIMDDRAIYQNFTQPEITTFLTIERDRLLTLNRSIQLTGKLGPSSSANAVLDAALFQKIAGTSPHGRVIAQLVGDAFRPSLIIKDDRTSLKKEITFFGKGQVSSHLAANHSFLIQTENEKQEIQDGIRVIYGHIKGANGEPLNLIGEYNMNRQSFNVGPVVLRVQDGDEMKILFQSFYSNVTCETPEKGSPTLCPLADRN